MSSTKENLELYEDKERADKKAGLAYQNRYSPYCDFIYYPSSRTPGIKLAMRVLKPAAAGGLIAGTHGWHMSIKDFTHMDQPQPGLAGLTLQVDMRGRAWSQGSPDCNGLELMDVIDAIEYAKVHYANLLPDPDLVYFSAGSGGGGNALALAGKFPDYFAAINALCGISDYAKWYRGDQVGEFRDELDVWLGPLAKDTAMAYAAASGITTVANLHTPLFLAHGELDKRVPVSQSRDYIKAAELAGKDQLVTYLELAGVGGSSHFENASPADLAQIDDLSARNITRHKKRPLLDRKGKLLVAGYLVTRHFTIFLENLGTVAFLDYDLDRKHFQLKSKSPCRYTLSYTGKDGKKELTGTSLPV